MIILSNKHAAEIAKRLETMEQTLARLTYEVDEVLSEASRARLAATNAETSASSTVKHQKELTEALNKVVAETPALPFERANAMLGRVSGIRHFLNQLEERSRQ